MLCLVEKRYFVIAQDPDGEEQLVEGVGSLFVQNFPLTKQMKKK
jgi:hypothetical protein